MYGEIPVPGQYDQTQTYTEQDFAKAIQELHGYAASLADSKQRYKDTDDSRYLDSIKAIQPYYDAALQKARTISQALYHQDLPSSFMQGLSDVGDFFQNTIKNLSSPFVLVTVALAAFMIFGGGSKLIKQRR